MINHSSGKRNLISRIKNRFNTYLFRTLLDKVFYPQLPLFIKFFKVVAETGEGTDICLKEGFLPLKVNYYSPVPDIADLQRRNIWQNKSVLAGIDFREEKQIELIRELGRNYGDECKWPSNPTGNPLEFYTENNSFSFGCAASLYTIIRMYQPRRVFEIGSGNSSLIFSSALTRNARDGSSCEYSIIDPYPAPLLEQGLPELKRIIKERVELVDPLFFDELEENDILFIDSGHTVRTGGDVNFLFLDILPRLAPGVIIHIHDINLPHEYPEVYFTNPTFRMFWTEAYLLQAFLCFNPQFEVMLTMNYLMVEKMEEFQHAFRHYDPRQHKAISGSFWIRRKG